MRIFLVGLLGAMLAACGGDDGAAVGGECTATGACGEGLTCNTAVAGGYCTKACTMTGETSECPSGAVCDTVEGTITCVQICEDDTDCRAGLDCNGVSGSNLKACKPVEGDVPDAGATDAAGP